MSLVCLSPNGVDVYHVNEALGDILIATVDGVARVTRDGDAWRKQAGALKGLHVGSLMREPSRGWLYAGIHGIGLYRSRDNGATWELARNGIAQDHVFSLACRETTGGVELYAGTEPAHLYRSTDYGDSWQELPGVRAVPSLEQWNFPAPPFAPHVKHIAFDPRDSKIIYVCIEQGAVLKSEDGGTSFDELHFQDETYALNQDTHRIIFNPRDPDEIFLPGGDGISVSRDAGKHWRHLTTPEMRVAYPDHFYVSPDEEHRLFAAGGGDPPNVWRETGTAHSAIVTSGDNGESWTQILGGLPEELAGNIEAVTMAQWLGGYGFLAGTTDGELFASFDKGKSWRLIASGLPAVSKCVHARNLAMGRAKMREKASA
jgi:photosystem II stability/assembly factor-like uncharacterized protein